MKNFKFWMILTIWSLIGGVVGWFMGDFMMEGIKPHQQDFLEARVLWPLGGFMFFAWLGVLSPWLNKLYKS